MASLSACCEDASIASKLANHAVRGRSHNSHRPGMNQIDACAHTAGGRVLGAHSFLEAAGMEQAEDDKLAPRSACSQALKPSPKPLPLRLTFSGTWPHTFKIGYSIQTMLSVFRWFLFSREWVVGGLKVNPRKKTWIQ